MNILQHFQDKSVQTLEQLKKENVDGLTLRKLSEIEIPVELCEEIFSYMTGPELTNCVLVSKEWYKVAGQERLWNGIVQQYAIGPTMWKKKVNADIGKADPIPKEMLKILRQCCPFFEGKQVGQTHMLVWIPSFIDGNPLTLNSLGQFVKDKSFSKNNEGYGYYWSGVKNQMGDKKIEQPGWVLMTKDVLLGSKNKSYSQQKKMVEQYSKYEVPKAVEAAFCIIAKYYSSDKRLYSDSPWTFTRCYEQVYDRQVCVGGFALTGLQVFYFLADRVYDGIAVLRKFAI